VRKTAIIALFLFVGCLGSVLFAETAPETPYLTDTDKTSDGWLSAGWRIAASPSGYEWDNGDTDEVVDFTIFQAADGTWQLIACVRKCTFPVAYETGKNYRGRILFRWESDDLFASDWKEMGVFKTTDDLPPGVPVKNNKGMIQAPHVVKDNGLYYMIYNSKDAHMMVSTNGKDWADQADFSGNYTFFKMAGGRDIMLVDNRDVDGKWYAVHTPQTKGYDSRGYELVYHTAENLLGPWSGPAGMAKRDFWQDVESPFIVRRTGWYYLFLQDWVYAEQKLTDYFDAPLTDLHSFNRMPRRGIAPEIVSYQGKDYFAAYNTIKTDPHEGIEIRPMLWKTTQPKNEQKEK